MIRQAEYNDLPEITRLYRMGLTELGMEYKDHLTEQKSEVCLHLAPCFLVVVGGNIVGLAGLTLITASHNGQVSLADYMFFVEKKHRTLKTLNNLVREIKAFADEKDLPVRLEFITNTEPKIRERLFTMNGFKVSSVIGVYNG